MKKSFFREILLIGLFVLVSSLVASFNFSKFLVFVVLVPLFYITFNFKFPKNIILLFIASFLTYILSFRWVLNYNLNTFLIASMVFMLPYLLTPLLFLFYEKMLKKKDKIIFVVIVSLIWVILSKYFIFFWMNFAIFWPLSAPLVWLIKSKGITFLIVLFNGILVLPKKREIKYALAFFSLIIVWCSLFSLFHETKFEKDLSVAIVQGNTNYSWYDRLDNSDEIFEMYKNLTLDIKEKVDLIIWPEYAILKDPINDKEYLNDLMELSNKINSTLILGAPVMKEKGPISHLAPRYDTAFFINQNHSWDFRYAESVPINGYDLITVDNVKTFSNKEMNIGVILCWEETQSKIIRKIVDQKIDIMISLSNNQRFDDTMGIYVTSLFSRLYAAENRIYWIRATNTGITQIINPQGKIIRSLPTLNRNVLKYDFASN